MNPSITIFKACTAHFQLQVLLAVQMNIETMGGLIEQSIIQGMTNVLHDDINLMRCTPYAHELGLKLVINLCYYTSVSPNHCVLAIGAFTISAKSNNLRLPTCI